MRLASFTSAPVHTHLHRRQAFAFRASVGQCIECRSGQLWVTQDGDPRDVILEANQCFTLDRSGRALVSALEDASFVLRNAEALPRVLSPVRATARAEALSNCAY
jgi:hypothetical protein